jgi:hypothetical protein
MVLIVVGCFIVGLSSVLDEAAYEPRHYPPNEPPYDSPSDLYQDANATTTTLFSSSILRRVLDANDDVDCNVTHSTGAQHSDMAENVGRAAMEWTRRVVGVLFFGLRGDGSSEDPDECKASTRPLIGNLCVMAAQVCLFIFSESLQYLLLYVQYSRTSTQTNCVQFLHIEVDGTRVHA